MWTPDLKKWGSVDPLDPVASRPSGNTYVRRDMYLGISYASYLNTEEL